MIISHLLGGLGNQMFQYAAGRALSERLAQKLLLDVNDFQAYKLHQGYELNRIFGIETTLATLSDSEQILRWRANKVAKKVLKRKLFTSIRGNQLIFEPHFHYWGGLSDLQAEDAYLYGYWQSEKYFQNARELIRRDFIFKEPLESENLVLQESMKAHNAISIHIRRGDYLSNLKNQKIFHLIPVEYYWKAIRYMSERISSPHFYIFSDDTLWAKNSLPISYPCTYVEHNRGLSSYRDMQLMSKCQHHIIANSSFSWWGAWLNPAPEKIVVAPSQWFKNHFSDQDLMPEKWVRL
ncbi:alpha-1,2-fucosyltransferase [Polynucleobacter paneuropaeus]|nr:alpha-1,2-fucosyltransferase [Polynucleobacter paneuropaeus]